MNFNSNSLLWSHIYGVISSTLVWQSIVNLNPALNWSWPLFNSLLIPIEGPSLNLEILARGPGDYEWIRIFCNAWPLAALLLDKSFAVREIWVIFVIAFWFNQLLDLELLICLNFMNFGLRIWVPRHRIACRQINNFNRWLERIKITPLKELLQIQSWLHFIILGR